MKNEFKKFVNRVERGLFILFIALLFPLISTAYSGDRTTRILIVIIMGLVLIGIYRLWDYEKKIVQQIDTEKEPQ